jgi:hypothetical protein
MQAGMANGAAGRWILDTGHKAADVDVSVRSIGAATPRQSTHKSVAFGMRQRVVDNRDQVIDLKRLAQRRGYAQKTGRRQ